MLPAIPLANPEPTEGHQPVLELDSLAPRPVPKSIILSLRSQAAAVSLVSLSDLPGQS